MTDAVAAAVISERDDVAAIALNKRGGYRSRYKRDIRGGGMRQHGTNEMAAAT